MEKPRVLFISSEIIPYSPQSEIGTIARNLPQGTQEANKEVRIFMPRYGSINERRHQLHEVIRLSGMNIVIDDADHPLIIKVGSVPQARMQVYFIDNEEFFQRKAALSSKEGKFFEDNDERAIFFCRGVLETVKKLGWSPDVIHCHGWMTALIPTLIKTVYKDDPIYKNSKTIYSVYNNSFEGVLNNRFAEKFMFDEITTADVKGLEVPSFVNLNKYALQNADAVIQGSENIHEELVNEMGNLDKPVLPYQSPENYIETYNSFYEEILEENTVLN